MLENTIDIASLEKYFDQVDDILESSKVKISSLRPSEWVEKRIPTVSYEKTPYTREIIDRFAPDDPFRDIALMGSAQFGKTYSIIIPVIGFIIENDPGPIIMTVGHDDLVPEAMDKIDGMLDSTGLRKLIKPTAQRVKNQKTGDTNTIKQFPNGYLKLSSASNPKIWRQTSYKYGLIDDYEAIKKATKIAGNQRDLIEKRFTAFEKTMKRLWVSSPEREQDSNILEVFLMGDQRRYVVPCPCCRVHIELKWSVEGKNGIMAGITWKVDEEGKLIAESVGYICQECGDFFTDQYKSDFVNRGYWRPTAKPFRPDFCSYHMSSLYSPPGMTDWTGYVYKWLEAHPAGRQRDETKYQTFLNLNLGEPYKQTGEAPAANELQKNIRNYEIGTVPEKLSQRDGNGRIVLLTCACDLNGVEDDARLDYEVVGWSETGANYSIMHGSIGTFVPRENSMKIKEDRERWTYHHGKPNSVWPKLRDILNAKITTDTGRNMRIFIAGVDCGHYTNHAYAFLDKPNVAGTLVVGLKGDKDGKYRKFGQDTPATRPARERTGLYMVEVNQVKDEMAA
jgi:phage terminase large subunit GpA-like protein